MKNTLTKNPAFARVTPFVVFMAFIGLEQMLRAMLEHQVLDFEDTALYWLYLPKVMLVGVILWIYRRDYSEITLKDLFEGRKTALSIFSGLLVFFLWVNMDWTLGANGKPPGFNPDVFSSQGIKWLIISIRVSGAVIIVPIMEELFWRSFLLRYLINSNFLSVAIGRFSFFSCIAVAILFGLEHHYVFAGIMAGLVFNIIYYISRSIVQCILCHAVANLGLAIYVLNSGHWNFW